MVRPGNGYPSKPALPPREDRVPPDKEHYRVGERLRPVSEGLLMPNDKDSKDPEITWPAWFLRVIKFLGGASILVFLLAATAAVFASAIKLCLVLLEWIS